ncbi:hypothetical protein LWI28_015759 [Acer negundo]|uniref:Uncharacterized protein n=1 Tax=Acer negundo TaxID=4023 RepID=A0AAD5JAR1_ACENE|nr:hypothetical protein LWI28_015759 [Acer negundo]
MFNLVLVTCSLVLTQTQYTRIVSLRPRFSPKPKISFLFIARNLLPLDLVWDKFFKIDWGEASRIEAKRILLRHALSNPFSERFVFVSDRRAMFQVLRKQILKISPLPCQPILKANQKHPSSSFLRVSFSNSTKTEHVTQTKMNYDQSQKAKLKPTQLQFPNMRSTRYLCQSCKQLQRVAWNRTGNSFKLRTMQKQVKTATRNSLGNSLRFHERRN